jgi:hypothetical protein
MKIFDIQAINVIPNAYCDMKNEYKLVSDIVLASRFTAQLDIGCSVEFKMTGKFEWSAFIDGHILRLMVYMLRYHKVQNILIFKYTVYNDCKPVYKLCGNAPVSEMDAKKILAYGIDLVSKD